MNHCLNIFNFRNSSLQIGECMGVAHMSLFISIAPKLVQRSGNQPAIHLPHINPINNLYFPIGILKNDEWHETKSQVIFVSFSTAITSCRCAHSAHYQPAVILVQKRNFFLINFLVYFFFLKTRSDSPPPWHIQVTSPASEMPSQPTCYRYLDVSVGCFDSRLPLYGDRRNKQSKLLMK